MYYVEVMDREGGLINESTHYELFETYEEAESAGKFWQDDPRYGSHEVFLEDI